MTLQSILVQGEVQTQAAVVSTTAERERESQVTIDFKMITFELSGKDYAIDIMNVKEIAKAGNFTYVPNALPFVVGVYNLRGEIIPILDMRIFFNIPVPQISNRDLENLLILTVEDQTFGIVVDKIDKVVGVQKSTIQPPHPLFGDINVKYISGVVESNKRLYILLDIALIFARGNLDNSKTPQTAGMALVRQPVANIADSPVNNAGLASAVNTAAVQQKVETAEEKPVALDKNAQDYKFIAEGLKTLKKFSVSQINERWVKTRFSEWTSKGKGQFQNEAEADEFLKPFWSAFSEKWWSKEFADSIFAALPENTAKQIVVWNPGCGIGIESYCFACVLAKKYPESKIKLYAQDIDLLNISNAPMTIVPDEEAKGWLKPFLSKSASGKFVFEQKIKDSIMFEYHDCTHTNALPMTDIIFARDLLSILDADVLQGVLSDFEEKLKGNGVVFVGDNEEIHGNFLENTVGNVTTYKRQ